jgi:hypothetical protein
MNWLAGRGIKYCMDVNVGLGGYGLDIRSAYELVRRTGYRILYGCCRRIRRIVIKYSLSECIGQPEEQLNIVWM